MFILVKFTVVESGQYVDGIAPIAGLRVAAGRCCRASMGESIGTFLYCSNSLI